MRAIGTAIPGKRQGSGYAGQPGPWGVILLGKASDQEPGQEDGA
ncbi:hypothetical protein [[Clostridium] scindens]|nr:hypothetical protein [[Clostridium] scindens]